MLESILGNNIAYVVGIFELEEGPYVTRKILIIAVRGDVFLEIQEAC